MNLLKLIFAIFIFVPILSVSQPSLKIMPASDGSTVWILNDLVSSSATGITIAGKPETVTCKYGKALLFNGTTDGIFLDQMPLDGLNKFTVEIIMCPHSGGSPEQRYFHCGEVKGNRVLLELRSTQTDWYLDAFVKAGEQLKTLIEPGFTHPLDQWAHIAFVVDHGKQETFVNGKKELESMIEFAPLHGGKTSLAVRQNSTSWFKGEIYEIRISHEALVPSQFLKL
jgi:hypothetical protein